MAWWDQLLSSAGGYAQNNPLEALSLGTGAVGSGLGILDLIRAQQAQAERRKLAEQLYAQGPQAYMPHRTPQQMAAYMRPYSADLATRGIDPSSGSGQAALADALSRAYQTDYGLGLETYNQKLGALGQIQAPQATGDVGGFGKALAYAMLARAMRPQQPSNPSPGITDFGQPGAASDYRAGERDPYPMSSMDFSVPNYRLQGGDMTTGSGGRMYSLTGGEMS